MNTRKYKIIVAIEFIVLAITAFLIGTQIKKAVSNIIRKEDIEVISNLLELAEAQHQYIVKTEALLDSINNWDETFMDTVMETDAYYEYEVAREKLSEGCQKKNTTNLRT